MAMCMYLNSGSVLNARLLSRVSDGSARPFTAQAYSILSFVGVNTYLCDANDDDDDDALVMMMSSFPREMRRDDAHNRDVCSNKQKNRKIVKSKNRTF